MTAHVREAAVKRWCFTLFDYQLIYDSLIDRLSQNSEYAIIGKEVCPETNRPHLQGYVSFKSRLRLPQVKTIISARAHLEHARGSPAKNFEYCSKSGDYWQHGQMPRYGRGSSSIVPSRYEASKAFIEEMAKDADIKKFMDSYPNIFLFHGHNMLANYYSTFKPIRRDAIKCYWIYGATGVGKSHLAHELFPNAYIKPNSHKWFHNYRLEREVIIDELEGSIPISLLLIWADKYPCTVETKGSVMPLYATTIVVTSNYSPAQLYPAASPMLERRFETFLTNSREDTTTIKYNIMLGMELSNS